MKNLQIASGKALRSRGASGRGVVHPNVLAIRHVQAGANNVLKLTAARQLGSARCARSWRLTGDRNLNSGIFLLFRSSLPFALNVMDTSPWSA